MQATATLSCDVGKKPACEAMSVSRATFYRHIDAEPNPVVKRLAPLLALSQVERQVVLDQLHNERFQDMDRWRFMPACWTRAACVFASHDVRIYPPSTMGLKSAVGTFSGRLQQAGTFTTAPNQIWFWDITELKGSAKWTYFYLYVILDIFSHLVVGWMVAIGNSIPGSTAD